MATALPALIGMAGVGLSGYGAYESTKAQQRMEDKQRQAEQQREQASRERRAALAGSLNQYRAQISGMPTNGYSDEEKKNLTDEVDFTTDEKGKDLSASLIKSILGRNIDPNSGAVTGAAAELAGTLAKFRQGKKFEIENASLAQKKAEEAAKRQAEANYTATEGAGWDSIGSSDLNSLSDSVREYNDVQGSKGKQFSDLSNSLISSVSGIKGIGGTEASGNAMVDLYNKLTKRKKALASGNNPLSNAGVTEDDVFALGKTAYANRG